MQRLGQRGRPGGRLAVRLHKTDEDGQQPADVWLLALCSQTGLRNDASNKTSTQADKQLLFSERYNDTNLEVLQRNIPHVQKAEKVQLALGAKTFNFAWDKRKGGEILRRWERILG